MNDERPRSGMAWPIGIALGLLLVIAVNGTLAWIAVTHADEVVPSYNVGQR